MFSAAHRIFNSLLGVWKSVIKHGLSCLIIASYIVLQLSSVFYYLSFSYFQGGIQEFLKGGLYTTEVTLNTNGVEGE